MAKMAKECMAMWDELEDDAGETLRLMTGLLNFGDPTYGAGGPEGKSFPSHRLRFDVS